MTKIDLYKISLYKIVDCFNTIYHLQYLTDVFIISEIDFINFDNILKNPKRYNFEYIDFAFSRIIYPDISIKK